ncbi:MAG: acyl-ACP--UDP-N-acetylglucosamine O-acyltransferase [Nitrospirae bacterium]|nr:acyl-ACP--UDP-N-acetylglucosamine O-acyltransferase [Nitrospirota bacterium]
MAKTKIHRTSVVSSAAQIADGVEIGPFCIIGKGVTIGKNTRLVSHVTVKESEIGDDCMIYPFSSIGLAPQDTKYHNEKTGVRIGSRNIIRESVTIHRASVKGTGFTDVGDNNFIMAYSHIAHDCKVGNSVIMANSTTLAGHVDVEDYAVIGGLVAIHQFTRIGTCSMIGGVSGVSQDVPPYTMASGNRAKLYGLNTTGLKRQGIDDASILELKRAYKILFRSKLTLKEAIEMVRTDVKQTKEIEHLIRFLEKSEKRGICR